MTTPKPLPSLVPFGASLGPPIDEQPSLAYRTTHGEMMQGTIEAVLDADLCSGVEKDVQLLLTSPPFPLNRKKKYGNLTGTEYVNWLAGLAPRLADPESHIMPAPGGRDFLQAYNCQAVVDSAHQVIVAAQATNQTSDKQQAVAMVEETIDNVGAVPKEVSADAGYYSAQAVEGLYGLGVDPFVAPERTRHGRVVRPRPGVAYPVICLPGIGCAGSCRPNGVGSATLCGCKRWSRCSARSSRVGASGSSCYGAWRRSAASGR